jgi:hypothetical protein
VPKLRNEPNHQKDYLKISKYTKFEDVYMNTLRIISFRKSDIYYEMYCNFCSWDARPKNNLLISNFIIFESLLFEGYSCKCLQTFYAY